MKVAKKLIVPHKVTAAPIANHLILLKTTPTVLKDITSSDGFFPTLSAAILLTFERKYSEKASFSRKTTMASRRTVAPVEKYIIELVMLSELPPLKCVAMALAMLTTNPAIA